MEQKMRQKRQTTGMIQASDFRSKSAKSRSSSGNRRELHGMFVLGFLILLYIKILLFINRLRWAYAVFNV